MPTESPPRPDKNTYWVVPFKFLAGEYSGDKDPDKARKKIRQFLAAGIRHFVDLTEGGELAPYDCDSVRGNPEFEDKGNLSTVSDPRCQRAQRFRTSGCNSLRDRSSHQGGRGGLPGLLGAAWVAVGSWSRAGCKGTAEHRATLWPS
jgi:hypothetical protein